MAEKNTVEVVIDGKIYDLSGSESETYLHEVAGYLNAKISKFKKEVRDYHNMDAELRDLLLEVNICDDLFIEREKTKKAEREMQEQERESYAAKHDLINTRMKLEEAKRKLEEAERKLALLSEKEGSAG